MAFASGSPAAPRVIAPRVPSDRILRASMHALAATLAGVYLFSAVTAPAGHGAAAGIEAAIGGLQLAWVAVVAIGRARRWPYLIGTALQLALTCLWIVSRTAGLPGVGRLPVGEFDLLCAADALVVAALAWRCAGGRLLAAGAGRLAVSQLAVVLAASTLSMSLAGVMTMAPSAAGAWSHAHAGPHYFCHLL